MRACAPSNAVMTDNYSLTESMPNSAFTFDDVRGAAEALVAHGRRADALVLVIEALETLDDPRCTLLLARLHLESDTRPGAEEAASILGFWRHRHRENPEALALLRCALREVGRSDDLAKLDREVGWTSMSSCHPIANRPRN